MSEMMEQSEAGGERIRDFPFSDLYLEPSGTWYKRSPRDRERHELPHHVEQEVMDLRENLQTHKTGFDFRAHWDGVSLRVQRLETLDGDVYVCRRLLAKPIPFDEIGYPLPLRAAMLSEAFSRGGLVLFTGGTGDGKSMTLASWMIERLKSFGGTACTVENPIEIVLQGKYQGQHNVIGTCYQSEVRADADFGPKIVQLLRAAPNIIMLGEIRTRDAAHEAVLAGTSGHLVGATLHANDPITAIERIKNMIQEAGLDVSFLADSLSAVFHQRMTVRRFANEERRVLNVQPLIIAGATNETSIRANIRSGDISMLSSELLRQKGIADSGAEGRPGAKF